MPKRTVDDTPRWDAGRRKILKALGALGSAFALAPARVLLHAAEPSPEAPPQSEPLPKRPLGMTGVEVSILALGGAHLGRAANEREAIRIVHEAMDAGLTFMDNAWEYNEGRSEEWMGKALQGRRHQAFLMSKVCTHGRGKRVAMRQLEDSLRRLRTDYLDLWQIHEVIYDDDPDRHFQPDGAAEALRQAREQGKVRFRGFTGHKDPALLLRMMLRGYPFDTCQLPLNCFDANFRSFEREVLPELTRHGIAAIGMKALSGNGDAIKQKVLTPEEALRYALSLPVTSVVTGIDSLDVLRQNLSIARRFRPMTQAEMHQLRTRAASQATDGRFELYKTSAKFDGHVGRGLHASSVSEQP